MVADSINLMRRTHMKSVLKALAIAALSTAPAIAQEWSGPYVGATASVATLRTAWTDVEYDWFGGTVDQRRSKLNGGLQWGYNNQKGNSVIGWELDYRPGHVYINTDMGNLPPVLEKTDALRHRQIQCHCFRLSCPRPNVGHLFRIAAILLRLFFKVTRKTRKHHKIWGVPDASQRHFADLSRSCGYQLSLNHFIARRSDRAG